MAKEQKKGLGKGLGVLFGGDVALDGLTRPQAEPLFKTPEAAPKGLMWKHRRMTNSAWLM